jgi:hypothetical protein
MAERRMIAKSIVFSDDFLDMPLSSRCLYFTLLSIADDDGFINNPKSIIRQCGASNDDLRLLIAKSYIIPFESGVIVIKHWKIHNYIQADRRKPTLYQEEKNMLITQKDKSYALKNDEPLEPLKNEQCIQSVSKMDTQVRLGKVRLGKVSINNPPISPLKGESGEVKKPKAEKEPKGKAIYKDLPSELKDAMIDFESMRTKMRKPLTDRARKLLITRLTKLASDDNGNIDTQLAVKIVEQSLERSWASFYEIKSDNGNYQGKTNNSDTLPYSGLDW